MQICLFEDLNCEHFEPLIYSRPTYNLYSGMMRLRDKIKRAYPGVDIHFHTREYLEPFIALKNPGYTVNKVEHNDILFINGRILAPLNLDEIIPLKDNANKLYVNGDTIIAARVSGKKLEEINKSMDKLFDVSIFDGLFVEHVDVKYATYIWDLIFNSKNEIENDFIRVKQERNIKPGEYNRGTILDGVHLIERDNIHIAEGAIVMPGVVIDASRGPVMIDRNATVYPNAVLEGPVYIGEGTKVKSCAMIYEGASIGKICKVGGEIEESIILPYTNKQHQGFLGHAYLGSWVNIGADTNNSDLKNNYGTVKITVNGEQVDSGMQFLGLIMGDHSKTAINTMFNTGTVVGFSSNIFGAGFPDKYIPSFAWGGVDSFTTYDIEKSIETAKRVVARRGRTISSQEEYLFRKVFELTQKQRRKLGFPY